MKRRSLICFLSACAVLAEGCSGGGGNNSTTGTGGGGAGGAGNGTATGGGAGSAGAGSGGRGTGGTGGSAGTSSIGTGGKGGAAGSGSAGTSDGGATGGSSGGAGTVGATPCTGQVVSSQAPVTLAATIDCKAEYGVSIAGRQMMDEAYLGFTTLSPGRGDAQLAMIGSGGVSVEVPGIEAREILVMLDATDAPQLVGSEIDNQGVGMFVRSNASWQREIVSPIPTDTYTFYNAYGAALGADGQPRVVFAGSNPASLELDLAQRSAAASWSTAEIAPSDAVPAGLAIDSKSRARVIYQQPVPSPGTGYSLYDWVEGLPVRALGSGVTGIDFPLGVAAGLNGLVGVAHVDYSAIGVTFSDGETAARDQTVPGTALLGTCPCKTGNCKMDGIKTGPLALAATSDGAFWLAVALDHVDLDITATIVGTEGQVCQSTTTADRSTEEIVLMRFVADGSTAATTKWRLSTPFGSTSALSLASRGPRLYLAVSERLIRAFAFDWANL